MHFLELDIPDVGVPVKFKMLGLEESQMFHISAAELDESSYKRAVIEKVIYNFKSDVAMVVRELPKTGAARVLDLLYNHAIMLNPGLDYDSWLSLGHADGSAVGVTNTSKPRRKRRTKAEAEAEKGYLFDKVKFLNLERHLKERVIGQNEAISEIVSVLKRSFAGLGDVDRPLGVFLFAGSSGIGKTYLAKELHKYLFGDSYNIVRIDCGEYQHKHENQKFTGSPPGYIGHEDGGILANQILEHPNTVLLIDEIEKAHPDILDTFLRIFDEGMLTDSQGREVNFRNTIVIMTTNLGNKKIVDAMTGKRTGFGRESLHVALEEAKLPSRATIESETDEAVRKALKPELLNRLDRVVVFNHLTQADYQLIAALELQILQEKLARQGYGVVYDPDVVTSMIELGVNPVEGARKLSRIRRKFIEDPLADLLLETTHPMGTIFQLLPDEVRKFRVLTQLPAPKTGGIEVTKER